MDPHRFDAYTSRFRPSASRSDLGQFTAAVAFLAMLGSPANDEKRAVAGNNKKRRRRCGGPGRKRLCARNCGQQKLCGKSVDCGVCPCATAADCVAAGTGDLCCAGSCATGLCCEAKTCANPTPACLDHACAPCTATEQCIAGQVCEAGGICCKPEGAPCTDALPCCSGTCDFLVRG